MPENCLYVHVHELGYGRIPKVYVFKGSEELTKEQVLEHMGFSANKPKQTIRVIAGARDGLSQESIARFLLPASECEFTLSLIFEELQKDPWSVSTDQMTILAPH